MSSLLFTLPPLSPDYSGVASVLHDTGALVVIHDASGCTGTYAGYDEPRWFGSTSPIFCSGLREMDAILGDDEKLLDKIRSFVASRSVPFIAIVGSPVPLVVGFDFRGFAALVERETGIPAFGFATNGLKLHDTGASDAYLQIANRFVEKDIPKSVRGVNILGASALDSCDSLTLDMMEGLLADEGLDLVSVWGSRSGLDELRNAASAQVNWVVSAAALPLARWFSENCHIPFVAGFPAGVTEYERISRALIAFSRGEGKEEDIYPRITNNTATNETKSAGATLLITGEPLFAMSLASAVSAECPKIGDVRTAGFFGTGSVWPGSHWITFADEAEATCVLNDTALDFIAGDPLLERLLETESRVRYIPIPHTAISGRLHNDSRSRFFGSGAVTIINESTGGLHA